jgi:hypothetical protein
MLRLPLSLSNFRASCKEKNASRSIIYVGNDENFTEAARAEALRMQQQMEVELEKAGGG